MLALNERFVNLLSPLDENRLKQLLDWDARAEIICWDSAFAGFVITFVAGSAYDSVNYRWFAQGYAPDNTEFGYLDRIVLDPVFRRRRLGSAVYDELEGRAGRVFTLEVNVEPPNEPSLAFHRARGYTEVHRQESSGHLVGLFTKELG